MEPKTGAVYGGINQGHGQRTTDMTEMSKVAIIGTTSWGTTLGILLSRGGMEVSLWARTEEEAEKLNRNNENAAHLPGFSFPPTLQSTASIAKALTDARLVILAVPSQDMRHNARLLEGYLDNSMLIVNVAKGLEVDSAKRMSQVIAEEIDHRLHPNICVLSGPNLSQEIAQGLPATTVIAAYEASVATNVQMMMSSSLFRAYTNTDVVGVELGGVLKNIIALSAGMVDGLEYGNNTKAGLITRGLAEITRLGVAAGANPLTFAGLAGLGDLVATCSSSLSRNRLVGQELAIGRKLEEIAASMQGIAEGVTTTIPALKLAREFKVEMPITEQVYRVLYEGLDVRQAVTELMERELKHEFAGIFTTNPNEFGG
ncbi:MAG: NAD(P)H-dependent glycerol-3-phosphate dehydrogenase [Chloroflexota bacterium]|nr:NAD(P)H-dependent glycerol-3-phosphate dehydrogenase [Chloroflexota bacterium]